MCLPVIGGKYLEHTLQVGHCFDWAKNDSLNAKADEEQYAMKPDTLF